MLQVIQQTLGLQIFFTGTLEFCLYLQSFEIALRFVRNKLGFPLQYIVSFSRSLYLMPHI